MPTAASYLVQDTPAQHEHIDKVQQKKADEKEKAQAEVATAMQKLKISPNQVAKNPRPVEYRGLDAFHTRNISESEWRDRLELAVLGRGLYLYGFGSDLAAQCIITRIRDEPDAMLMNEWGFFFEETTASSLVKVKFGPGTPMEGVHVRPDGSLQSPAKADVVNIGCVPVARAIFNARPDVNCVIHTHPYAVMAVGGTKEGLLPLSQAAFFMHGTVGRYKYNFDYGDEFEEDIARQFREGKRCMILDHHGLYAVGVDAKDAWFACYHLNQACEVQIKAMSMGRELNLPWSEECLQRQYASMMTSTDYAYDGSREWAGFVRKVNRELPGYEV